MLLIAASTWAAGGADHVGSVTAVDVARHTITV
jgi:hypothetical protein